MEGEAKKRKKEREISEPMQLFDLFWLDVFWLCSTPCATRLWAIISSDRPAFHFNKPVSLKRDKRGKRETDGEGGI